ncbi:MAG: type II toxin-antitoxin system VapC family toxin [Saprospiraceae bacterium]
MVDTHVILWDHLDHKRMTSKAKRAIIQADENHQIVICEISLWEIAMLMKKKRLKLHISYPDFIDEILHARNYILQGISPEIANMSSEINIGTNDPADNIITASAMVLGIPLITADQSIQKFPELKTIW